MPFNRDDKKNKYEKKEKYQSIINEDDADTIGFSFKTFGKTDSVIERGCTSRGFCQWILFYCKKNYLLPKKCKKNNF